jgi:hypothetical protein
MKVYLNIAPKTRRLAPSLWTKVLAARKVGLSGTDAQGPENLEAKTKIVVVVVAVVRAMDQNDEHDAAVTSVLKKQDQHTPGPDLYVSMDPPVYKLALMSALRKHNCLGMYNVTKDVRLCKLFEKDASDKWRLSVPGRETIAQVSCSLCEIELACPHNVHRLRHRNI